jgi:NAD(P)-dependent dehydrogenase (short-subunit alcohol dehydrogenase family)
MTPDQTPTSFVDLFRLDGRVAVVTGSGRGIGRGIALGMAGAGADVVVTARRAHEVEEVTAEVQALGRRALGVVADITVDDTISMLVHRAVSELGRLDIWVSNAGGSEHKGNYSSLEMPDEHWDAQFELNLRPHFRAAKACAEVMDPGSSLIGISSTASLGPSVRYAAYGAAKAGMNQLTRTLSIELAPRGIRANALAVGIVPTESLRTIGGVRDESLPDLARTVPLGRLGDPQDVAAASVYLASPAASWVTGQTLAVNGGR